MSFKLFYTKNDKKEKQLSKVWRFHGKCLILPSGKRENAIASMKYPIGMQSFDQIINGGFVYVDKTDLGRDAGILVSTSRQRKVR